LFLFFFAGSEQNAEFSFLPLKPSPIELGTSWMIKKQNKTEQGLLRYVTNLFLSLSILEKIFQNDTINAAKFDCILSCLKN
jgi:hypothetical protein